MPATPVFFDTYVYNSLAWRKVSTEFWGPRISGWWGKAVQCAAVCLRARASPSLRSTWTCSSSRAPSACAARSPRATLSPQPCGTPQPHLLHHHGLCSPPGLCLSPPSLAQFQPQGSPGCFADAPGTVLPQAFALVVPSEMSSPR